MLFSLKCNYFSNTFATLKELNGLCKHMKNVRSNQRCISMNSFSKAQVLPCEYR